MNKNIKAYLFPECLQYLSVLFGFAALFQKHKWRVKREASGSARPPVAAVAALYDLVSLSKLSTLSKVLISK